MDSEIEKQVRQRLMKYGTEEFERLVNQFSVWQTLNADVFPYFTKDLEKQKQEMLEYLEMMKSVVAKGK